MTLLTLLLIALGVSADAFAVALGKGLQMPRFEARAAARLAVVFGLFQAGMPLLGYLLGTGLERYITTIDHWIVFALLSVVGTKMIYEALKDDTDADGYGANRPPATSATRTTGRVGRRELLVLAVATSLDALAVGIGFAFLELNVAVAVTLIGVCTAVLSFAGVALGQRVGGRARTPAELVGGLILIAIGTKVLLDHLGLL